MRNNKGSAVNYYDHNLVAVIILLVGFGLVMLYSTTSYTALIRFNDDMYYFRRQAVYSVIAIALAVIVSLFVRVRWIYRLSGAVYLLSLVLMAMVKFSPLGVELNGARRWLNLGIVTFQPSELAKIAVIVYIPVVILKEGRHYKGFKAVLPPFLLGAIQAAAAYFFTENLSTALIILLIACVVIFIAHPKTWPFLLALACAFGGCILLVISVRNAGATGSFRWNRILVWLDPESYADSGGYQVLQGLYAIGSGGLFGKGLGNSTQKLGAVPEAENDMIFTIICEELGIFGGVVVILLFIYLLYRLFFIAQNSPTLYGSLMTAGIFGHIALQVILNICVAVNLIPTTGVTLPFVSYGGTSVFLLMLEMSLALAVSREITFKSTQRDLWGEVEGEVPVPDE